MEDPRGGEFGAPLVRGGKFPDDPVDGLLIVHGNLHGEHSAGAEQGEHVPDEPGMVGDPLDAGVGNTTSNPSPQVRANSGIADPELHVRVIVLRGFDHLR